MGLRMGAVFTALGGMSHYLPEQLISGLKILSGATLLRRVFALNGPSERGLPGLADDELIAAIRSAEAQ